MKRRTNFAENNLIKSNKSINKLTKMQWLPKSLFLKFIIMIFIFSDFLLIYQLTETYYTQSVVFSVLCAGVAACVIDLIPSALAGMIKLNHKEKIHYIGMSAMIAVLFAAFAILFILRWHSQDLIYDISGTQLSISGISETSASMGQDNSAGKTAMTVFSGFLPIATSIFSFVVSLCDDQENEKKQKAQIASITRKIDLANIEADNAEISSLLKTDLKGRNERLKELELDDINQKKIILKEQIRLQMAMAVGTPQALTEVMEQNK